MESIRHQTFKDYELIVICDSCADKTEQIAREYADIVKTVEYHTDGLTRNEGLNIAQGEYIIFVDSDDWLLHEFVLGMIDKKIKESPCDILAFSFIIKDLMFAHPKDDNDHYWTGAPTKVYNRKFIANTRFNSKPIDSDVDFTEELLRKEPRIIDWDMPLYYYNYLREGSYESTRH